MPLNKAERKMKKDLEATYGKARGEKIFYSMEKQGKTPHSKEDKGTMKAKKKGYAKGGVVKCNCGASMKPNRKARK